MNPILIHCECDNKKGRPNSENYWMKQADWMDIDTKEMIFICPFCGNKIKVTQETEKSGWY